jgi:cell wall assembly regulator SMI1
MLFVGCNFMKLSNHFENIINKQKSLDFNFSDVLRPAADKILITRTEQILNIEFNNELNELYTFADGTIVRTERNSLLCIIPFYDILSLTDAVEYYKAVLNGEANFYNSDKNYSPGIKLFPFLEADGGDCYWVDLNKETENYNKIYWTTTLAQEPDYLFNSLNSMFETIAECYEKGIISVDADGILSCDYVAWGQVAEKNNPNLDYWKSYNNPT